MKPASAATKRRRAGRPVVTTPDQLLERLVQAAIALLREQGADADLSVAQIAARAKVSKRTVYTVVQGKEELLAHVIRRDVEAVAARLDAPVASVQEAQAMLARFLAEWADLACGPVAVGIFVMAICERSRFPAIGATYQRARAEHGLDKLAAWLAHMDEQKFLAVAQPRLTAEFILAMLASERQRTLALGLDAPQPAAELALRITAIMGFLSLGHFP